MPAAGADAKSDWRCGVGEQLRGFGQGTQQLIDERLATGQDARAAGACRRCFAARPARSAPWICEQMAQGAAQGLARWEARAELTQEQAGAREGRERVRPRIQSAFARAGHARPRPRSGATCRPSSRCMSGAAQGPAGVQVNTRSSSPS